MKWCMGREDLSSPLTPLAPRGRGAGGEGGFRQAQPSGFRYACCDRTSTCNFFPHPQPFSLKEKGESPLAQWEWGRGVALSLSKG